jgi:ADP-heptose:LPS heptosyltransferase
MTNRFASRLLAVSLATGRRAFRRRSRPPVPRRILIAHHLLLGDTLLLTELLKKVRWNYPHAEIEMTVAGAFAPLYASRPFGLRALPFEPRSAANLHQLSGGEAYDLALVPGDNRMSWAAAAIGAKWIVAMAGDKPMKNLCVDEFIGWPRAPMSASAMFAELCPGTAPPPFVSADWARPSCRRFTHPSGDYAVLHVGASTALKYWDKWPQLAEALAARGLTPIWSGGSADRGVIRNLDPSQRWSSFAGRLDLPQLWSLLAGARLVVSLDTGVAHLARIAGARLVTLFGPGSAEIHGTAPFWRGRLQRDVSIAISCRDQTLLFRREIAWVRRCQRSPNQCAANLCMRGIDLAAVLHAAEELLAQDAALR